MQGVLKTRLNTEARRYSSAQEYERPKSDRSRLRSVSEYTLDFFLVFLKLILFHHMLSMFHI